MSDAPDLPAAQAILRTGSKSFAAAAALLDRETREGALLLYAWCRHCDDVIDGQALGAVRAGAASAETAAARLRTLRRLTHAALRGQPMGGLPFEALHAVTARHAIPHVYAYQLLDGLAMDVHGARYDSIEDTLRYCYHVAGVVGLMMGRVLGVRDEDTLDHACDLGIAFQLTNICRDVLDDAAMGRVYLPAQWLRREGVEPGAIARPEHRAALARTVAAVLDLADDYYRSAAAGIARLPTRSAIAIETARAVYRDIGAEVRRRGPAAWDRRVSTSKGRKIALALRSCTRVLVPDRRPRVDRSRLWTRPTTAAADVRPT